MGSTFTKPVINLPTYFSFLNCTIFCIFNDFLYKVVCCFTLFPWNIHVRRSFHYSCSYSNVAFTKLKKEAHRSWKIQDQPKPTTLSFSPAFSQPSTINKVFNYDHTPESTEIPSSSPKEFDVTFVSQGTYEINFTIRL